MTSTPDDVNSSVLGRLLEEISWDGARVRRYRNGGRGDENVLTAEVLGPLSYLPRSTFLAAVLRASHGAPDVCEQVASEAELAEITLLPDESALAPGGTKVQPDALMTTPSCHLLIEAKGTGRPVFQTEQLARELACAVRDAGSASPMLLLVLPTAPPFAVKGHGRMSIEESIALNLESVLVRTDGLDVSADDLVARIPDLVGWITWHEIQQVVAEADLDIDGLPATVIGTIERLRSDLVRAVDWHSQRR